MVKIKEIDNYTWTIQIWFYFRKLNTTFPCPGSGDAFEVTEYRKIHLHACKIGCICSLHEYRVSHTRIHKHTHFCLCVCYHRLGLFSYIPGPAYTCPQCALVLPVLGRHLHHLVTCQRLQFLHPFPSPFLLPSWNQLTLLSVRLISLPPGVKRGQISLLGIFGFRHSKRASCTDQPFCN